MTEAQEKRKVDNHKARYSEKITREKQDRQNNRVFATIKIAVMIFAYFMTYFTCNDYISLCMSYFVMALTIGSDILIILLTTKKSSIQHTVSLGVFILSIVITAILFFESWNAITFIPAQNKLRIGPDLSIAISWGYLKLINMVIIFVLICTYSLEHTGVLKMPSKALLSKRG